MRDDQIKAMMALARMGISSHPDDMTPEVVSMVLSTEELLQELEESSPKPERLLESAA
jgi:hypothetical protein